MESHSISSHEDQEDNESGDVRINLKPANEEEDN